MHKSPHPGLFEDQEPHHSSLTIITLEQILHNQSSQQEPKVAIHSSSFKMETRGMKASACRAANTASGGFQPHQTPAGMGTLETLPPELRNRIYKFVLVEEKPVKLQSYQPSDKLYYRTSGKLTSRFADKEVAPVNHYRDLQHRGQHWNGMFWTEIPNKTALTQVNKQLNSETSSILYGCNTFDFTTTVALERFLNQIGNNKRYLRIVGLSCSPLGHVFASGNRAMVALQVATSLHTLSVTNFPIEHIDISSDRVRLSIREHVEMFAPLLTSLHATLQATGRGADILNVVKINRRLPGDRPHRAEISCPGHCGRTCIWHRPDKPVYHLAEGDCSFPCNQVCLEYRTRYEYLKAVVKEEVAIKLGLVSPS